MDTGPREVRLEPWSAFWVRSFEDEARRLKRVFAGPDVRVEHIGSTAVPGLPAKPIIDVLVGVHALTEAESRIEAMEEIGYEYVPAYESEIPERRYFRKPRTRPRSHHVHCVVRGGPLWSRHLAFRDHLRTHPETASAYGTLKQELAARHGADRAAYLAGKEPFIRQVLEEVGAA